MPWFKILKKSNDLKPMFFTGTSDGLIPQSWKKDKKCKVNTNGCYSSLEVKVG